LIIVENFDGRPFLLGHWIERPSPITRLRSLVDCGSVQCARNLSRHSDTAAFFRNYDPSDVFVTLGKVVGRHPAFFITGASAAGFLFGFAARSKFSAKPRNASGGPISTRNS
jgi:hypothetical protein